MLKIYGSMLCKDCIQCCADLDACGVEYEFLDFRDDLSYLKAFLAIRDQSDLFTEIKKVGAIGIPCLVDDTLVSLTWEQYVGQDKA